MVARTEERLKKKNTKQSQRWKQWPTTLAMLMRESEMMTCDGRWHWWLCCQRWECVLVRVFWLHRDLWMEP